MNPTVQAGHDFAKGAFLYVAKLLLFWLALTLAGTFLAAVFDWGVDDTDRDGFNRSGLRILRDHGTGLEYLSDGRGGLIRRL